MTQAVIRASIESRLAAWAGAEGIPVAWQNVDYSRLSGLHLRAFLLPAPTMSTTLSGGDWRYVGLYQISIFAPPAVGPARAEQIVAGLEALFPAGLRMVRAGVEAIITEPLAPSPAMQETEWYVVPCRFRYRADVYRP